MVKNERSFFVHLFYEYKDGFYLEAIPQKIVTKLLSNIQSQIYDSDQILLKNRNEFKHFYMVKSGGVRLFDEKYSYMCNLEQGSFFGEYNIMFGLKSNIYYKTTHYSIIFRINS